MAHTVTILADSKGFTRPRVSGDEYVVDAVLDITSYTACLLYTSPSPRD